MGKADVPVHTRLRVGGETARAKATRFQLLRPLAQAYPTIIEVRWHLAVGGLPIYLPWRRQSADAIRNLDST